MDQIQETPKLMNIATFSVKKEATDAVSFCASLKLREPQPPMTSVPSDLSSVPAEIHIHPVNESNPTLVSVKTSVPSLQDSGVQNEVTTPTSLGESSVTEHPSNTNIEGPVRTTKFKKTIRMFQEKNLELEKTMDQYLAMLLIVRSKPSSQGREKLAAAFSFWNEHAKRREFTPLQYQTMKKALFDTRDALNQHRLQGKLKWKQEMEAARSFVATIPTFRSLAEFRTYKATQVKGLIGKLCGRNVFQRVVEPQLLRIEQTLVQSMAA